MRCPARLPDRPAAGGVDHRKAAHANSVHGRPPLRLPRSEAADARESRALISSPRHRVTAATTAQACER